MPSPMKSTRIMTIAAPLLAGVALAAMMSLATSAAHAQQDAAENTEQAEATDEAPAPAEAEPLPENIDFDALAVPLDLPYTPPKRKQLPATANGTAPVWTRSDETNGMTAVSVSRPISSFWDIKAGVDLDVATQTSPLRTPATLPDKLASDARSETLNGSAWMSAKAPGVPYLSDQVTLEARMNPSREARLGTALSKSLPLSEQFSLTLRQGYYVTQHDAIPGLPGTSVHGRSFEMDRSARLNIVETGTSFVAAQSRSPTGDRWLNSIGAEQQLFGGLSITGSVSETAEGFNNTSLTAGFKKSW